MKSLFAVAGTILLLSLAISLGTARQTSPATGQNVEIGILSESTWSHFVADGKEVDAIYGDVVVRNGVLSAVIAQPTASRHANMTVRDVAGAIIDLTVQAAPNDQLAAFYPGKKLFPYRSISAHDADGMIVSLDTPFKSSVSGEVQVKSEGTDDRPEALVTYRLGATDPFLTVTTTWTNRSQKPLSVSLEDDLRVDGGREEVTRSPNGMTNRFWLNDRFWGQAYGLDCDGYGLQLTSDSRTTAIKYQQTDGTTSITLEPGGVFTFQRRLYPGRNLLEVNAIATNLQPSNSTNVLFNVKNRRGDPVPQALIELKQHDEFYGTARTDSLGTVRTILPNVSLTADISIFGNKIAANVPVAVSTEPVNLTVDFDPGIVMATITDGENRLIPCKVEFTPRTDGVNLNYGPDTGEFAVRNLVYTANGKFQKAVPPGLYSVTISHGPEFDAAFLDLTVPPGESVPLVAKLIRSVETTGWVSSDFHSHSSPSGDNTSSQLGRVLNLVAEHIEFAPCTEHNRVSTYQPHIDRLGIGSQMMTVSGIELTGLPLPLNHQNAFPMKLVPRTQDGGGPVAGPDLETQIERLALHDGRSEKLLQVNHPDLGWMFYDKNGDGESDSGFERAFPFMDVVEIHPIDHVLSLGPLTEMGGKQYHNTIFNWLQLLNQGFRIYGVVNTDSHYNYHGSGWLRNWIQSSTDDPARIDPMEMVHAAERGRLVMSNGPYLEMTAQETGRTEIAVAGDDLKATSGQVSLKVRVQCPNWLDIDTVFVLVNGRVYQPHHYTRMQNPDAFRGGVVKFEKTLDLELKSDAHIIVVAGHSQGKLERVYGAEAGRARPAAMTNPLFVDLQGDGFQANRDLLDAPLPVRFPR